MTKEQIKKLKSALKKAKQLEISSSLQRNNLAKLITDFTGVQGNVDYLQGDGFGFTPLSNDDTHVGVCDIIKWAENGEIITEELILDRLAF
jgi:hypothetical protein